MDSSVFNVGIFGRIIPSKKPHSALNIAEMAKDNGLKIRFNFIGGGKLEKEIEDRIAQMGLSKYVFIHGMQDEPFKYIVNMDCILHLCEHESLSRAIRESLFFEIPVVAFNGAGNIELLNEDLSNLLFFDEKDAYNKIKLLYNSFDKNKFIKNKIIKKETESLVILNKFLLEKK